MAARTLVVILGETRAHELTFALFKQNVLDTLQADLALCVGTTTSTAPDPFRAAAKYTWEYPEPSDWTGAFDAYGEGRDWRGLLAVRDQWLGGVKHPTLQQGGSGGVLLVFREFLRRQAVESGVLDQYDWLVVTRSDMMWPTPHVPPALLSPDHIYFPDAERYRGYTDRHVIVPRKHFASFLAIPQPVFAEPEALLGRMQKLDREDWNIETFLKFRLDEMGLTSAIRFFPYFMYAVRMGDGATRGATGNYSAEHRFFIKYRSEYAIAQIVQTLVRSPGDWKYLLGRRRFVSWRMWVYCLLRAEAEKPGMVGGLVFPRLVKRFFVTLLQPIDPSRLDRLR
ncbi:MAG TPA: hypothetical protein VMI56_02460 [Reyranella sp.]|nr:hypothetical protein [Reyranella sp.]